VRANHTTNGIVPAKERESYPRPVVESFWCLVAAPSPPQANTDSDFRPSLLDTRPRFRTPILILILIPVPSVPGDRLGDAP